MDQIKKYDLLILGAGPGGYLLAERIGKKMNTAIIEKEWFGGTCLNVGCIPSKALLYSRKVLNYVRHGENYGIEVEGINFNHEAVLARKDVVVKMLVSGVEAKVKANKVSIFKGTGKIIKKDQDGFHVSVNDQVLITKNLVIATGSVASIPPIKGLSEQMVNKDKIMTNIEILSMKKLPKNLLIIGGGVIGLEMAGYFREIVPTLNVVEFQDHIAGATDLEISNQLFNYYKTKGINFHLSSAVTEIKDKVVVIKDLKTNTEKELPYEKILIATGRTPFIKDLGLENINVATEKNAIITDDKCKTNIANVYAIGDVNGKWMLAHTAYREAEVVVNQLLGNTYDRIDYGAIPSVIYTQPEIAAVGKTEEELKAEGIPYTVRKMPTLYSGRFVSEVINYKENKAEYNGLVKMLIHEKTREILGFHIIGQYATEIISIASIMITKRMTVDLVKDVVMPHPTVAELIHELIMEEK